MHDVSSQKVTFKCNICNQIFKQEANLLNHRKAGCGGATNNADTRKCDKCGKNISKANIARNRRSCMPEQQQEPQPARNGITARVYVPKNGPCRICCRMLSKSNVARHLTNCDQQQEAELKALSRSRQSGKKATFVVMTLKNYITFYTVRYMNRTRKIIPFIQLGIWIALGNNDTLYKVMYMNSTRE